MMRLAESAAPTMEWTQPSALKMNYELRAGDDVVGTLKFRTSFGSFATGEIEDGRWTLKRVGFWRPKATVRAGDSEDTIATFTNHTWSGGGTIELADGRSFRMTSNFWQTKLEIQDESEAPLIRFQNRGVIHLSAAIEIDPRAVTMPELPWLLMLGWYVILLSHRDSASAAAAAAAG